MKQELVAKKHNKMTYNIRMGVIMKRLTMSLVGLASLLLISGCDREINSDVQVVDNASNASENCLQCHSGLLDQAQGEWVNSVHASGTSVDYTNRGGRDCTKCHDQQGFIQFLATGELPDEPFSTVSAIGCFTCHNPHENGDLSLRVSGAFTLLDGNVFDHGEGNLCANCHHANTNVLTIADNQRISNRFGPHHGPQADMLVGAGGFEFPDEGYTFASSPHDTDVPNACIGCHMGNPEIHEGYDVGGHSFSMEDEESGTNMAELCADASCHDNEAEDYDFEADEDYDNDGSVEGYQTEVAGMLDSLGVLLYAQGVVDEEYVPITDTIADANLAGAVYNLVFVREDRSEGVHNFRYARDLLLNSIDYVSQLSVPSVPPMEATPTVAVAMIKSH
jgi:hypothetical protein